MVVDMPRRAKSKMRLRQVQVFPWGTELVRWERRRSVLERAQVRNPAGRCPTRSVAASFQGSANHNAPMKTIPTRHVDTSEEKGNPTVNRPACQCLPPVGTRGHVHFVEYRLKIALPFIHNIMVELFQHLLGRSIASPITGGSIEKKRTHRNT